jgi:hypothetical protein
LIVNGVEYVSDSDKANLFADRLSNTFCDSQDDKFNDNFKKETEELVKNHKFTFEPNLSFKLEDLNIAIKELKVKSSPGLDGITNIQLKSLSPEFKMLLVKLFNESLKQSVVPSSWKESSIKMIPKKTLNSKDPKDYRPISLTSCIAKLCERLILKKLNEFLENKGLIIKQQSGFRRQRQTKDNLAYLTQKIIESFNRRKKVLSIFFDIQAAFDRVWHAGLIRKMIEIGIPSLIVLWVSKFLDKRNFCVIVGNTTSNKRIATAGVPQGAVLSPTLFSIYINDLPKNEKKHKTNFLLFADDLTSFFIYRKCNNKLKKKIYNYLKELEEWLSCWRLNMSASKSSFIIFNNNSKNLSEDFELSLFNERIEKSETVTFLGLRFDSKLSFQYQLKYLLDSCNKRLNIIKILSNKSWKIDTDLLVQIYILLIRSLLEYSSIIYTCLSKENKNKLQIIQNNSLRIILKKNSHTRISELHKLANIDTIESRLRKLNSSYFRRGLINKNPIILELINEYINFSAARTVKKETPLCPVKDELLILLNSLQPP